MSSTEPFFNLILIAAGVASFGELLGVVSGRGSGGESDAGGTNAVLRALQQVAVLVQGNWVVKSDLLYPRGGFTESGLPNDVLQRARDYLVSQWGVHHFKFEDTILYWFPFR